MINTTNFLGPIAIGGGGGSGTRVVAEILKQVGFYIGSDLNSANDNLWFTLLFKRPKWFVKNSNTESEIFKGLRIFEKAMTASHSFRLDEYFFIMKAALKMSFKGHDHLNSGSGMWPIKRILTILNFRKIDVSGYIGWGWKEPNTYIYIKYLHKYFDNLKYIHVIRHGLDMAYSSNQAQLYNWGDILGIKSPDSSIPLPKASLQYWIESNKRTITFCRKFFKGRFLLLNFDQLCLNPEREISLLMAFLGLDIKHVDMDKLKSLPKIPKSTGRYKKHDLTCFNKDEIDAVRSLGFIVDFNYVGKTEKA